MELRIVREEEEEKKKKPIKIGKATLSIIWDDKFGESCSNVSRGNHGAGRTRFTSPGIVHTIWVDPYGHVTA